MKLTKKQINDYKDFLMKHKGILQKYYPHLTSTQARFCEVVWDIIHNPILTQKSIATRNDCSERSVDRATKIIKLCTLPFRISIRLQCRTLEDKFKGAQTALGKMTEHALRRRLIRWGKKGKI